MTDYTPKTEDVRFDYATATKGDGRPGEERAKAFNRWRERDKAEAQVEVLREAADDWHEEHVGTRPVPYKWLHARADRIAREAGIETGEIK